ncbi:MAG: trypsin-like peptidase domain-containing protein [Micromonosporaceae bacterium]|nr:trypsin-like peptidase domain-containing protein [Micromonosporaceae bacterium]
MGGPFPGGPPPASGKVARGIGIGIAAIALSLCSGVVGGVVVHQTDSSSPAPAVTTHQAAPVIDRSSVAGVAASVAPTVVVVSTAEGEGSGVILTEDGAVLTNNHVIENAQGGKVTVTFSSGKSAAATIVGTDTVGDIAVLKAQGVSGLTPATFGDSDALRIGDTVLALGSPLGLEGSVTEGIVSALHRTIDTGQSSEGTRSSITDAIQTDAAINPGNSGGPLVNLAGQVVGINTAIATSSEGSGSIGLGFAIPSNRAKSAADQLLAGGKVAHPYLGVRVSDGEGGAVVADVVAGGPAAQAGLQRGDIVTKINDQVVEDSSDLVAAVRAAKPGDEIRVTFRRDGAERQVTATLTNTP